MNTFDATTLSPCPDPTCVEGKILVRNVYNEDPLQAEEQPCDKCNARGVVVSEHFLAN